MMEKKVCALAVLAALSAAWAFEVPPVKQWPKEKIHGACGADSCTAPRRSTTTRSARG